MNKNNRKKSKNIYKPYNGTSRELVLKIHEFVIKIRNERVYGQRTISKEIKKKYGVILSENTISGWIHRHIIPFANEKTQFKSKQIPPKKELFNLYIKKMISASRIAQKYKVATATVIDWLKNSGIKLRSHTESMNTPNIRKELCDLRLTKPTKDYNKLTPEKAYILGVLCGDGYIDKNFAKLEIRKDIEFIEEFLRCFKQVYGINYNYYFYNRRNSYIANIASRVICRDLLHYGDFGTKKWGAPIAILNSEDVSIKSSFLKGFYDSEGHVGEYAITLTSYSKKAIGDICKLLDQLKIKHIIYKSSKYPVIGIKKKENLRLFRELIGFTIKRKMEKLR